MFHLSPNGTFFFLNVVVRGCKMVNKGKNNVNYIKNILYAYNNF